MKVTIVANDSALVSHAQGLLEHYCRKYVSEGRDSKRKAVGYWMRDVYSALVWGDMQHVRVEISKVEEPT